MKLEGSMHAAFVKILYRGHTRVVKNACHLVSMGFSFCFFVCCSVGTKHNVHRGLGLFGNAVSRPWPSCRNAVLVQCCHMCISYCTRLCSAKEPFSYSCNWHKELSALLFSAGFPSLRLPKTKLRAFLSGHRAVWPSLTGHQAQRVYGYTPPTYNLIHSWWVVRKRAVVW